MKFLTRENKSELRAHASRVGLASPVYLLSEEKRLSGIPNDLAVKQAYQSFPTLWPMVCHIWGESPSNSAGDTSIEVPVQSPLSSDIGPPSKSTTLPPVFQSHLDVVEARRKELKAGLPLFSREVFKRFQSGKKATSKDVFEWLFNNLWMDDASPETAPNPGSWFYLQWLRGDQSRLDAFYNTTFNKTLGTQSQMDEENKFSDDGRKLDGLADSLLVAMGSSLSSTSYDSVGDS